MDALLVLFMYLGLFVFALNGIIYSGMRAERIKIRAQEERLRRILMKLRR